MKKNIFLAIVIAAILLSSCNNEVKSDNGKKINATIEINDFEKKLIENPSIQLVDVRTPEEFNQGHLKGALNYNINASAFETEIAKLDKSKPVMVYCLSGGRSASAAEIMEHNGFSEIYNMQGGIMKWSADSKSLVSAEGVTESKGMTVDEFNTLIKTGKYVLVDYNAKWCKPCKKMAPMLDAFTESRKEALSLLKIDADENKVLLKENKVEALPVLELYKDGKLLWRHEGEIDEATLIKETKL